MKYTLKSQRKLLIQSWIGYREQTIKRIHDTIQNQRSCLYSDEDRIKVFLSFEHFNKEF